MLQLIHKFIRNPQQLPTIEEWSMRHANKASPDGLIAAAVVESLAQHWEDWEEHDLKIKTDYYRYPDYSPALINSKKKLVIKFGITKWRSDSDGRRGGSTSWYSADWRSEGMRVNDILIELKAARYITAGYERIAKQQKKLQETAARAKQEMKESKQKWDLAENLLGMKRNEFGALVPIKTVEDVECLPSTESINSPEPITSDLLVSAATSTWPSTSSMKPQASRRRTKIALA